MKKIICHGFLTACALGVSSLVAGAGAEEGVALQRGEGGRRARLSGGDFVHVWTTPGSYSFAVPGTGPVSLRYLVVGGGGAGGSGGGGGGGAGAVKEGAFTLSGGETVNFTVGAGGKGHLVYGYRGTNGEASTLTAGAMTVTAVGGGAGGSGRDVEYTPNAGASGGGAGATRKGAVAGGAATDGQAGGSGNGTAVADWYTGGGGGGAKTSGGNGGNYQAGRGGDGVTSDITGISLCYGGGGGGGGYDSSGKAASGQATAVAPGKGGLGGGGDGACAVGSAQNPCTDGEPGKDGTGGGGGAGGFIYGIAGTSFHANGAAGGSGTVILRYACTAAAQADDTDAEPVAEDPGALSFAHVFSDHAVLQRDKDLKIWGYAPAGTAVTVAFANGAETRTASATAVSDGTWEVTFAALAASADPGTLSVSDAAGHRKTLADILVGDVWLADGQSNMDMQLWQSTGSDGTAKTAPDATYLAAAADPTIRAMRVERMSSTTARTELPDNIRIGHSWDLVGNRFSAQTAFAFHFARQLRAKGVTVPLGYVTTSYGGTTVSGHRLSGIYYKAMVAPIVRYGIAGALWFQGESDAGSTHYATDLAAMVGEWRTAFGQGDFPFYWGQMSYDDRTAYDAAEATKIDSLAVVREQQRLAIDLVANGGMAVSFDIGAAGNVHFPVKAPVGERFAALALADVYHLETVREGPNVDHVTLEDGKIRVAYRASTLGSGLAVMKKGVDNNPPVTSTAALEGFALSEDGTSWTFAEAAIDGDDVVVSSAKVPSPRFVRYATMAVPLGHANLYNKEGFPATPFAAQEATGWVAKPNTVRFLNWDGAAISTQSLDDGAHPSAPTPDPVRAGWRFLGWTNVTDGVTILTGAQIAETTVSGNVTVTYAAAFKDNGGEVDPPFDPTKDLVEPPVLADKVYTGERQTADVGPSDYYSVVQNDGGTEVGRYPVVLRLFEPGTRTWPGTGAETYTVYFSITNAVTPTPPVDPGERVPTEYGYRQALDVGGVTNVVCVYTNTAEAGFTFTVPEGVSSLRYLVVGGGGSGGVGFNVIGGAGGGAGGLCEGTVDVTAGTAYAIRVGAGGGAVLGSEHAKRENFQAAGSNGCDSVIAVAGADLVRAIGGGGGGTWTYAATDGGSGGGGGTSNSAAFEKGGNGTVGQGHGGGRGYKWASAGGGGAGSAGGDADESLNGGAGGAGLVRDLTGAAVTYACGGAGAMGSGGLSNGTPADGGAGVGEAGCDGTGSGGGGAAMGYTNDSGKGGDGVVILRYVAAGEGPQPPEPPAHVHSYGDWAVTRPATCTATGVETRTCTAAGCTEPPATETREIAALGHAWGAWVVTTEPQVGVKGEETRTCTRAGCGATETRDVDPLPDPGPGPGPEPGPEPEPGEPVATEYGYRQLLDVGGVTNVVCVYTNTSTSGFVFTVPEGVTSLRYLVVGGGGGGGGWLGGGGGAGGFLEGELTEGLASGQEFAVVVGAGGAGGDLSVGVNGGNSSLGTGLVALGGGGGGYHKADSVAQKGGSGGGGASAGVVTGAVGTDGQGYAGGNGKTNYGTGGGGGAGGPGGSYDAAASTSGDGGIGRESDITGANAWYAGGGGGAANGKGRTAGKGSNGGGDGTGGDTGLGVGGDATTPGSGGGGSTTLQGKGVGGRGADGIVVIRYVLTGGEPEPRPTVDGQPVEPAKVFEVATSAKPIVYPSAPTLAGEVGAQTIAFGGVTVGVPVYYTAELNGAKVSLELNENAKPRIADGKDGTKAFELTADGEVKLHLTNVHAKLHYALETSVRLGDAWTTGAFAQGRADFTVARRGPSGFYRIAVVDSISSEPVSSL